MIVLTALESLEKVDGVVNASSCCEAMEVLAAVMTVVGSTFLWSKTAEFRDVRAENISGEFGVFAFLPVVPAPVVST